MSADHEPTLQRWFTGRRILVAMATATLAGVWLIWVWWTAPHRELAAALDGVQVPAGLVHLGDEQQGSRMCFFDNCPRLTRYYGSVLAPEELCRFVEDSLPGLDRVDDNRTGRPCSYWLRGLPGGHAASVSVREPILEIPPENSNELVEAVPVEIPHESVLRVSVRR